MAARLSLREYQRELSARLQGAAANRIVSKLGLEVADEAWLVDLADAAEVVPVPAITPVPLTRPWFKGMANIRGNLHSVVDLPAFFGHRPVEPGERARLLVVATRFRLAAALLVHGSLGLRHPSQLERRPADDTPWIRATYADSEARHWKELDLPQLVQHPQFVAVGL
jgi:twitching motility protein PilI